jgi:hypothetical protein
MTYKGLPPFTPADIIRIQDGLLQQRRQWAMRPKRRNIRLPLVLARRLRTKARKEKP